MLLRFTKWPIHFQLFGVILTFMPFLVVLIYRSKTWLFKKSNLRQRKLLGKNAIVLFSPPSWRSFCGTCAWSTLTSSVWMQMSFFPRELSIHHMLSISLMLTAIGTRQCGESSLQINQPEQPDYKTKWTWGKKIKDLPKSKTNLT